MSTIYLFDPDDLAVATIWMEARGELQIGRIGVGEVIRTRMRRRYSSDGTVAGTIARRFQFSGLNDDKQNNDYLIETLKIKRDDPTVIKCREAWIDSQDSNYTYGAVLYCNLAIAQPIWATPSRFLVKIDSHSFFRD